MFTAAIILLITICIISLIIVVWLNCCTYFNIYRRVDHRERNQERNMNVPPIIPITIGEEVDFESPDFLVIIAE
jgi:hypothetical protein